jgi:uncharacterized protein
MQVPITALYAGLLALILVALGFQVGLMRLNTGVSILHGTDMVLATRIRRHANFTEGVPLALLLLCILELNGSAPALLHGLGVVLVLARIAHPFGLHHDRLNHPLRGIGSVATTLVTVIAALVAIWGFVSG